MMAAQYPARTQDAKVTEPTAMSLVTYVEMKPPEVNSTPDSKKRSSARAGTRGVRRKPGTSRKGSAWRCLGSGNAKAAAKTPTAAHRIAAAISSREMEERAIDRK